MDEFPRTEPNVVLMIHDLESKMKDDLRSQGATAGSATGGLISCKNAWRIRWSYLIIFVAIYSVIFIPMRIAVYKDALDPWYTPLDFFTFLLYVLDVFVNLRTTYLDSFGEEIQDAKKIMKNYAGSPGFYIDVLSLGNYPMSDHPILSIIGILKVNRVLRISTLVKESNMDKGYKSMLMMLYYYFLFIIYLHLVGCMWFYFIEQTYNEYLKDSRYQPWIPPYDYYDGADNFWERYEQGDQ